MDSLLDLLKTIKMNSNHPMATPPHWYASDVTSGATEQSNIELTSNGQEDDGDSSEVRQRSKSAWARSYSDLNVVARGFNKSPATETNRDSEIGKPQSDDWANGHLTDPKPVTGNDGTTAERELSGKHPNVTLRSHPDEISTTPQQLVKSVAAELPSCKKATPNTISDDHSFNAAGSDQGTATNGSTIRGQDDSTGQSSRPTSNEASARSDITPNAAYETADQ